MIVVNASQFCCASYEKQVKGSEWLLRQSQKTDVIFNIKIDREVSDVTFFHDDLLR